MRIVLLFAIMNLRYFIFMIVLLMITRQSKSTLTFVHDLIQDNIAGAPVIHEQTEWDFHPDDGKARRVQFEALNGRHGEKLIERLGKGPGFRGPWGVKVEKAKPDLRYVK